MSWHSDKIKENETKLAAALEVGEDELAKTFQAAIDDYKQMQKQVN